MKTPSSRHLSHDFKAYKELTLRELFWVVISTTLMSTLLFILIGLWLGWPGALGALGFLMGFILSITLLPKPLAHFKRGKPYGYLIKQTHLILAHFKFKKSPYLTHVGVWQKSKRVRHFHV